MPLPPPDEREVLERLVGWAAARDEVRALVLTSTRASARDGVDDFSDYDVIVAVRDAERFVAAEAWRDAYGRRLVGWGDEHELYGETAYFRGLVHDDWVRIDWTVWPVALLDRVAERAELPDNLDVGYRVLLDKDGRTDGWPVPTYRAHVPRRPTEAEYRAAVEEFWWDTLYVAKSLWRGHVVVAKFSLDYDAKLVALRRVLEWRIELDHGWSLKPGVYGKGIEQLLPARDWRELEATYVGAAVEENWDALFRTAALFRRVAREVGDALGYPYPQEVDDGVGAHLRAIRAYPRSA